MSQNQPVTLPALPGPLRWQNEPQHWERLSDNALTITAGPKTDWFIDPDNGGGNGNAPALVGQVQRPCQLKALVSANHTTTYDAGVLAIYQSNQVWAKLCLELSPQGQIMVVSVVTRGTSDDCNSIPIAGNSAYLRVAKQDHAFAFHYSPDGVRWDFVRYFTFGNDADVEIGFLAQSPMGNGCTARFQEITYVPEKLNNLRSGE